MRRKSRNTLGLYDPATKENAEISFVKCWYDATWQGKDFYIMTHLKGADDTFSVLGHALVRSDGSIARSNSLNESDIGNLKPELHNITTSAVLPLPDTRVMVDRIRKLKTLFCFGAGHVAVPTIHLAALVGFQTVVIDDRAEFANTERFPGASKICVVEDFNRAFVGLEIDSDSYIVIVTRGHMYDQGGSGTISADKGRLYRHDQQSQKEGSRLSGFAGPGC